MNKELINFNKKLNNKKVAVIGAGVSNIPLLEYLSKYGAIVSLFDKNSLREDVMEIVDKYNIKTYTNKDYLKNLVGYDIIFRSPSCLPTNEYLQKEIKRGAIVTTEVELTIKYAPCKVIGITGSKGKTTTTTITNLILKNMGYNTFVGGNIGIPLFTKLENIKASDLIILELSSFQLMDMKVSPNIAIITNITPDHLDIHSSYEEYINAKKCIFTNQKKDDLLVLNYDDEIVKNFDKQAKSEVRYFSCHKQFNDSFTISNGNIVYINNLKEEILFNTKDIALKGNHNYLNIASSLTAIKDLIDKTKVFDILKDFNGVEHRMEFVREVNNVKWYNDSASTTPDKACAGISSFDKKITLIAGGYDKNLDYKPLAIAITKYVDKLILFGETSDKIYDCVMKMEDSRDIQIYKLDTLEEVVSVAYKITSKEGIVLFSPASASFDMFDNAYQRGDMFKDLVYKL